MDAQVLGGGSDPRRRLPWQKEVSLRSLQPTGFVWGSDVVYLIHGDVFEILKQSGIEFIHKLKRNHNDQTIPWRRCALLYTIPQKPACSEDLHDKITSAPLSSLISDCSVLHKWVTTSRGDSKIIGTIVVNLVETSNSHCSSLCKIYKSLVFSFSLLLQSHAFF